MRYPLLAQLVEMSLKPLTAEVEIQPRDIDARIEVDWYTSVNYSGETLAGAFLAALAQRRS